MTEGLGPMWWVDPDPGRRHEGLLLRWGLFFVGLYALHELFLLVYPVALLLWDDHVHRADPQQE